jgi:acyl carrier protein
MTLYQIARNILGEQDVALSEASHAGNTPGWNSLRHTEMIFAVESAYRVRFAGSEIMRIRKLGDLRSLLLAKGVSAERLGPAMGGGHEGVAVHAQVHRMSA